MFFLQSRGCIGVRTASPRPRSTNGRLFNVAFKKAGVAKASLPNPLDHSASSPLASSRGLIRGHGLFRALLHDSIREIFMPNLVLHHPLIAVALISSLKSFELLSLSNLYGRLPAACLHW